MISLLLSFLYFLITYFVKSRKFAKSHGAKSPKVLRHWDLFLGLDCVVYTARVTAKKLTFSDIQTNFREIGSAYVTRVLGDDFLFTDDPKNAQAILITQFPNFNMGGRRRQDTSKLLGHGIFNADGAYWEHSRALIRPDFIKKQVADLAINEEHAQHMMRQFPTDGKSVDLQSFFFHLVWCRIPSLVISVLIIRRLSIRLQTLCLANSSTRFTLMRAKALSASPGLLTTPSGPSHRSYVSVLLPSCTQGA